jgi:hypothetical protein
LLLLKSAQNPIELQTLLLDEFERNEKFLNIVKFAFFGVFATVNRLDAQRQAIAAAHVKHPISSEL